MGVPLRTIKDVPVAERHPTEGAYFYRRKPLEQYPWFCRFLVRFLYKRYGWNADDGSCESQGFYTVDEYEAKEIAEREGWAFQMLPVNSPLPNHTCQYGLNDVPWSGARRKMGVDRNLPWEAVARRESEKSIAKLRQSVHDLKSVLK